MHQKRRGRVHLLTARSEESTACFTGSQLLPVPLVFDHWTAALRALLDTHQG